MSPMMIDISNVPMPQSYTLRRVRGKRPVVLEVTHNQRPVRCPCCGADRLHSKGRYVRAVRHLAYLGQPCVWRVHTRRYTCTQCTRTFVPQLPAIRPWRRLSEPLRESIYTLHHAGIDATNLARLERVGSATVERCYSQFAQRKAHERISRQSPLWLGIDEHSVQKQHRFATTFCDLRNHRVFDVVPGRSVGALESYVRQLKGRERVKVVCIDLSSPYRALIKRYFPKAKIVADRFHVVRLVYQHFLELIRSISPEVTRHRGLLACLRRPRSRLRADQLERLQALIARYPPLAPILELREQLCTLLNHKTQTKRQCRGHARELLKLISRLEGSQLAALQSLAHTLRQWSEPIAAMWRFTKNNAITEGFHRKMKLIQRRAYGFRNFHHYRLRVIAQCG